NRSLSTDLKVVLPNLDLFKNPPSIFQLLADPSVVVDGLDNVLKALQDALSGEILGVQIPFIGDALANNPVTHFIENIREQILAPLANTLRANNVGLQGLINLVQDQLYDLFSDLGGADLIPNDTGNPDQIMVHGFGTNDPNANHFVEFDIALGHTETISKDV